MGKRRYWRQQQSLERRVREHLEKIAVERAKHWPDEGLIAYWKREIRAFRYGIEQAQKRQGSRR